MFLAELQRQFLDVLYDHCDSSNVIHHLSDHNTAPLRIAIYRNNLRVNLHHALSEHYPLIEQIVGAANFRLLAHHYSQSYPSKSGNLDQYGDQFTQFLSQFQHTATFPIFSEIAQVEWTLHQLTTAENSDACSHEQLHAIAVEDIAMTQFLPLPKRTILALSHDVTSLFYQEHEQNIPWQACPHIPSYLLCSRVDDEPCLYPLSADQYQFFLSLNNGLTYQEACNKAIEVNPECDLALCLELGLHWHYWYPPRLISSSSPQS
jgi:hypothetical protein